MTSTLPIREVTVHPDGALVTRRGAVTPRDGAVHLRGLPLLLDESSLRARVEGGRLRGLQLDLDLEGLDRSEDPAAFRAWRDAEHHLKQLKADRRGLKAQRERLDELLPPGPDEAYGSGESLPGVAQLKAWRRLTESLTARAAALDERVAALDEALREARERLELAYDALLRSSSEQLWRRWAPTRVLTLEIEAEGEVTLSLSYRVDGARWAPAYTLRADAGLQEGRLLMRAVVAQASGEDWRGVRLQLSSAPCARRVALPELSALRLGVAQAPPRPAWRPLPPGLDALFPEGDLSEPAPEAPPPMPRAPEGAAGFSRREAVEPEPELVMSRLEEEADLDESMDLEAGATAFFGGAPPPPAKPAAPPPPPQAMPAPVQSAPAMAPPAPMMMDAAVRSRSILPTLGGPPKAKKRAAPDRGGGGPPGGTAPQRVAAPPPPFEEPAADILDYPRLRLAGYGEPWGRRGRLHPVDLAARAEEAGLPAAGRSRLGEVLAAARRLARGVKAKRLPAHHVVPGPVMGAFARLEAGGEVDVPSNGDFTQVALRSHPARLELRYRSVPREDPRVFRRLLAELDVGGPMLPGPVDIYVGGSLVRSYPLSGGARGTTIVLGMGAEEGLKLARNVRYREETAGMFRGSRRLFTEIEVELASSLERDVEVELLERLPIAGDDELEVRLVEADPEAEEWKGDKGDLELSGGRRQRLRVPARGLARARFQYSVTMDNKLELVGGDRRG